MKQLQTTLTLFLKDNQILLGTKKKGFGKGKINVGNFNVAYDISLEMEVNGSKI